MLNGKYGDWTSLAGGNIMKSTSHLGGVGGGGLSIVKSFFQCGLKWRPGNEGCILFWLDGWCTEEILIEYVTIELDGDCRLAVV